MTAPICFSEQKVKQLGPYLEDVSVSWQQADLPTLRTALNTVGLARESRLLMLIFAGGHNLLQPETLIG